MDSDYLLKEIRKSSITDASIQAYFLESRSETLKVENSNFTGKETKHSSSLTIECIYNGRSAAFMINKQGKIDIQKAIRTVYKLAKDFGSSDSQKHFYSSNKKYVQKSRTKWGKSDFNKIGNAFRDIKQDKLIYSVNSYIHRYQYGLSIANDSGASAEFLNHASRIESEVISKDFNQQGSGMDLLEGKSISDLDIDKNIASAAKIAKSMLNARPAPTVYGKLILDPLAAIGFVGSIFDAINGEEVLKKKSFLSKFKNKQMASKIFNIYDSHFLSGSLYNRDFDDEMVPTSDKYLIKNGVFVNYLNDIYSAEKLKEKPKGNDFSLTFGGIRPVNAIIQTGKYGVADLIREVDKGIYLINTGDVPNLLTGDVSSMVSVGYYIENGEIKYPVKETLIGGNMLDMLKNIVKIGSEIRSLEGISAPSILIDNIKISGK